MLLVLLLFQSVICVFAVLTFIDKNIPTLWCPPEREYLNFILLLKVITTGYLFYKSGNKTFTIMMYIYIWVNPRENRHYGALRRESIRISQNMSRRLTRTDTFRLLRIFRFRNHYYIPLYPWNGICPSGLDCANCAGWSESIHYTESMKLVFSWNGWYCCFYEHIERTLYSLMRVIVNTNKLGTRIIALYSETLYE